MKEPSLLHRVDLKLPLNKFHSASRPFHDRLIACFPIKCSVDLSRVHAIALDPSRHDIIRPRQRRLIALQKQLAHAILPQAVPLLFPNPFLDILNIILCPLAEIFLGQTFI
jgi:hypothetical protein